MENAQLIACRRRGEKRVEVADILKAMSFEKGSVGFNIIKNLEFFKNLAANPKSVLPLKNKKPVGPIPFSMESHNVILGAIRGAQEFQFPYVGTEHLLFAILESNNKEALALIGKEKNELGKLLEHLKRVLSKSANTIEEPMFYLNFPKKVGRGEKLPKNVDPEKQEFLQEIMGEISEMLSSILEKRKGFEGETANPNFLSASRPPFGVIMPHSQMTEKFLDHFSHDINKDILAGKIDPIIGREKEIDDLITILMRKSKNNPVLVGEPGVGKTAIVAGLAWKIVEKDVPPALVGKRIMTLDLGLLVAGTSFRGEFEDRFKRIIEEAERDPNIILFIDEMHNLIGAGSAQGSLDAANIIKPALARGRLRCIGATTIEEYHRYIERDGALERRFQPIWVLEPSPLDTEKILKGIRRFYEEYHKVKISDLAIKEAVKLSNRYITDRFLPDKAIDLIDESSAFVVQDEHYRGTTKKLQRLEMQREKLRRIKEKMVQSNNLEMAASLKKSEKDLEGIILELERKVAQERKFIPVVDERDVAEVLSRKYNLPLELIMESSQERIKNLPRALKRQLKGQDEVINEVTDTLRRSLAGIADPDRPATAFLFVGPTGVGKTYLAKLIAKELFLKDDSIIRVDMSEFNEKHTVSRLIGSPPGYVGYGDTNNFTDKIRKNPYSLILFDEIEKAHPEVFHILLQVLEDGFLTDGMGRKINFRSSIIVFTSNLGNDEFLRKLMGFSDKGKIKKVGKSEKVNIRKKLEDFLRPEFLNRLSNIVYFRPLEIDNLKEIAYLEVSKLKQRLYQTKRIKLIVDRDILAKIAQKSQNKREGVRLLRRLIQKRIEEPIARDLLEKKITKGAKVIFGINTRKMPSSKKSFWLKMRVANPVKPYLIKYKERKVLVPSNHG